MDLQPEKNIKPEYKLIKYNYSNLILWSTVCLIKDKDILLTFIFKLFSIDFSSTSISYSNLYEDLHLLLNYLIINYNLFFHLWTNDIKF